jgi:hypothetical protein
MSANHSNSRKLKKHFSRHLAIATLLSAGILQPMLPILAVGTAGGLSIDNTATATFDNPNGGSTTVESNPVTLKVAEVAGISVTNVGITDGNSGSVTTNDTLSFDFRVTNMGNDATGIYLPAPSIVGATIAPANGYTILDSNGAVIATLPN